MPIDYIFLLGAGGHARVVFDALLLSDAFDPASIRWVDDDPACHGEVCMGHVIHAPFDRALLAGAGVHIAIGNNQVRHQQINIALASTGKLLSISHPKACISPFSTQGDGNFLAAYSILAANSRLGSGVIVNHGAVVDHDCVVGNACHIAPNATLAGGVELGERVLVGAGANILAGIRIGTDAVIGAGALVLHDVPAGATVIGVPSRPKTLQPRTL